MRKSQHFKRMAASAAVKAWSLSARIQARLESTLASPPNVPLKIALVKQHTYCDLYSTPGCFSPELIFSSNHRSGPVGLIKDLKAQFFIVREAEDPECRIWREKLPLSDRAEAKERREKERAVQYENACDSGDVNWSEFDLVIAIENAVPARITMQHPDVVWATMLEYQGMSQYRQYLKSPPKGYDFFFSQHFGPTPRSLWQGPMTIEWPYAFNLPKSISSLFPDNHERKAIFFENHQSEGELKVFEQHGYEVYKGGKRTCREHLEILSRSRVFVAPNAWRPLWGNASSEAASAGCLVIANRSQHWNPFLILPELDIRGSRKLSSVIQRIMDDDAYYGQLLSRQEELLAYFCYKRPLAQLLDAAGASISRKVSLQQ